MPKHLQTILCLLGIGFPVAANADFSVVPSTTQGRGQSGPSDKIYETDAEPAPLRRVVGFGNQVPLAFAIRQIVPAGVAVRYGPGADPAILVDWKGGAPWDQVLKASVKQAGLRVIVTWHAVQIRK